MKKTTTRNITLILTGLFMSSFAFADAQPIISVKCTETKNHGEHQGNYTIANVSKVPMGVLTIPSIAHPDKDKAIDPKHYYTLTASSPNCAMENNLVQSEFVKVPREVKKQIPAVTKLVPAVTKVIPAVTKTERYLLPCDTQQQQQGQSQQQLKGKGKCEEQWGERVVIVTPAHTEIVTPAHTEIVTPARTETITVYDTVQKFSLVKQADACQKQEQQQQQTGQEQQQAGACSQQQDQGQQTQQPPFVPACTGEVVTLNLFKADESPWNCEDRELTADLTKVGQSHVFNFYYNPGWSMHRVYVTCTATFEGKTELH